MSDAAGSDLGSSPDLEAIQADLAILKRDLAALMSHIKTGAKDGVNAAAGQVGDEVARLYETLERHVEEQPVQSLLIAFAVGFIGGRMLSR